MVYLDGTADSLDEDYQSIQKNILKKILKWLMNCFIIIFFLSSSSFDIPHFEGLLEE